jgi:hypothetical protein
MVIACFLEAKLCTERILICLAEAVADANKAIELDPSMHKAYLRKGLVMHLSASFIQYSLDGTLQSIAFLFLCDKKFLFAARHASSWRNTKLQRLLLRLVLPTHLVTQGLLV